MCDRIRGSRRRNRGFLLEQFLIPLIIALILVPVMTSCIGILGHGMSLADEVQDEIALAQLRHVMIASNDCQVYGSSVSCIYHEQDIRIEQVNRFLLIRPGTWIFLSDVDTCSFALEDQCIVLYYRRADRQYRRVLVHA